MISQHWSLTVSAFSSRSWIPLSPPASHHCLLMIMRWSLGSVGLCAAPLLLFLSAAGEETRQLVPSHAVSQSSFWLWSGEGHVVSLDQEHEAVRVGFLQAWFPGQQLQLHLRSNRNAASVLPSAPNEDL